MRSIAIQWQQNGNEHALCIYVHGCDRLEKVQDKQKNKWSSLVQLAEFCSAQIDRSLGSQGI